MRILVAGSGGGHLRQLLDLRRVWEGGEHLLVTEDTALGRSLADEHPVAFVPHFAFGQARLGKPWAMARNGWANLQASRRIVRGFRPDAIITTGAGSMFWTAFFAKADGARVYLVDSFARFDRPSLFARMVHPFATETIVQSQALKATFPGAPCFEPFKLLDTPPPPKRDQLFATVGATLGFPRLVEAVIALKASGDLPEPVILQYGDTPLPGSLPPGIEAVATLPFDRMKQLLAESRLVVSHGGTGSIVTALQAGCQTVVMPRLHALAEHYDDHQLEISEAMAARGLIEIADPQRPLAKALARARAKPPVVATTDMTELANYLTVRLAI